MDKTEVIEQRLDVALRQLGAIATQQERIKELVIELVQVCQHIALTYSTDEVAFVGKKTKELQELMAYPVPVAKLGDGQEAYIESSIDMLKFRPPVPLPRPRTRQISPPEQITCEWFFYWRKKAIGQKNITTREGLLLYVYGLKEGRATSTYDPMLGETMGQRVRRIIDQLKE